MGSPLFRQSGHGKPERAVHKMPFRSSSFAFAFFVVLLSISASDLSVAAVEFPSPTAFDSHIARHHHSLVLIGLEKGCPKCNILLSELQRVQIAAAARNSNLLSLVAVDVRQHKANVRDFDVTQVPTLLWFSRAGGGRARAANEALQTGRGIIRQQRIDARGLPYPEPFSGFDLTAEGISAFLNDKLGPGKTSVLADPPAGGDYVPPEPGASVGAAPPPPPPPGGEFVGVVLDDRTFYATVLNPDTFSLVLFCNGWNEECKAFRSTYAHVSHTFAADPRVTVAAVDVDAHQELAMNCGVIGVPTMQYYLQGTDDKEPHAYIHGSKHDDIVAFVRDKLRSVGWTSGATTSVMSGASLSDRFESVDDAIRHFFRVTEEFHATRDEVVRRDGAAAGQRAKPPQTVEDAIALILAEAADPKACSSSSGGNTKNSLSADPADGSVNTADAGQCGLKAFIPPEGREIYSRIARRVVERGVTYLHDEIRRVKHILETGALSELVRDQLAVKLAVLEVFASL